MSDTPVAVILVAGIGQRLRPLTDDRPKALVDVGGETILGRAVRQILAAGVREIVLATGYREEAVRDAMTSCAVPVRYCRNEAFDRTQNAVSLFLCREAVGDRAFFKLDGDLLFQDDVIGRLSSSAGELAVAVERRDDLGEEEMKVTADGDRVLSFGKHLVPATSAGESIGIERVSGVAVSSLFHGLEQAVSAGETTLYYEDVYARLIARGLDARLVDVTDLAWTEVDTPADLERARELVASGALGPRRV
jgi:choline kinase